MKYKGFRVLLTILLIVSLMYPYTYEARHVSAEENLTADLIVSADILYLREGPGLSYPIKDTLKQGQELTFIEKQDDWYHVKTNNMEGWVASWLTKSNSLSEQDSTKSNLKTVISQVDHLNLRSEPTLSAAILSRLNSGETAEVLAISNGWIQVSYNGTIGWVSDDYVTVMEEEASEQTMISEETTSETQKDSEKEIEIDPNLFTIAVDAVNIRKKADLTSKKIGTAKLGEKFEVLERDNNWVKIKFGKKEGWIYSFYGTFIIDEKLPVTSSEVNEQDLDQNYVTIIYNGTNLREKPSTSSDIIVNANAGQKYPILSVDGEWYQVEVQKNKTAYVANWVVAIEDELGGTGDPTDSSEEASKRKKGSLKGITIVLDPGHGGNDGGTTGVRGTEEKEVNLKTVELLVSKLRSAGAEVILTRETDVYVDLRKRVSISHQYNADAFVSIHYDATVDSSISGFTTYYTNSHQQELAQYVHAGLAEKVTIRDRGIQPGNYIVTRENKQAAILIELGYLSNPNEENIITTDYYRQQATLGIYEGLLNYFDAQLD